MFITKYYESCLRNTFHMSSVEFSELVIPWETLLLGKAMFPGMEMFQFIIG